MPPTPELQVQVREDVIADWCAKQNIPPPTVRVHYKRKLHGTTHTMLGSYTEGGLIDLYVLSDSLATASGQRLIHVTRQLNVTVLHELRHHWQHNTWSAETMARAGEGPYAKQRKEVDANEFADAFKSTLNTVRVKRSFGGGNLSGFGRLAATQKGIR